VLCDRWIEDPYFQFYCGEEFFQHRLPFDHVGYRGHDRQYHRAPIRRRRPQRPNRLQVQGLHVRPEAPAHTADQTRAAAARRHRTCDRSSHLGIRVGLCTSPQPRHLGSTRWRPSSPNSRVSGFSAASSDPSKSSRLPSTASSPKPMPIPNRSSGLLIRAASSPLSNAGSKR
jgi:hypothetical protein